MQDRRPDTTVEIIDGDLLPLENIIASLDADVVGISPKVFSYETATQIAQTAFASGSRVIVGGAWASAIPGPILRNRPYIDAVCIGDGEESLVAFADGVSLAEVPNIAYRDGQSIVVGESHAVNLDELPAIDYRLTNIEAYVANYRTRFPDHPFMRPLPYYSHKGCYWHDVSGGCIFCRHQRPESARRSAKRFWRDVTGIVDRYGADLVWDVSDTFTGPRQWVYEVLKAKPQGMDCRFYLYGRASDLDEKMVVLLQRLGCYEVLVGVESGNDALLKGANKGITRASILTAVEQCSQYGIQVFPTFVFGLPGENPASLEDTVALAQKIVGYGNIREISSAILLPLPASRVFARLSERLGHPSWLSGCDMLDLPRVQSTYIELFTDVSVEELRNAKREVDSLVAPNYRSTFGGFDTVPGGTSVREGKCE